MDQRHEEKSDAPINHLCNVQGKLKKFNYECSIENFSQRPEKTGERIESPTCVVGNNDEISVWCLYIYPHGSNESSKDFVSVYLTLLEPDRAKVKYYKLSILDDKEEEKQIRVNKVIEFNNRGWGFTKFIKRDVLLNESNGLLVNDKLTILCEAEIIGVNCENNNNSETSVNGSKPQSNLSLDLGNLLNSQMFTDCCIKVGETTIKVHRGILATRSPVFYKIFNGSSTELQTDVFEIKNFRVGVVEKMLRYIYTDDISDIKDMASEILAIAAEYGLDGLKEVAVKYLCDDLNIGNICELFILSETFASEELKECCEEFIVDNSEDLKKTDKWIELVRNHPFLVESLLQKSLNK